MSRFFDFFRAVPSPDTDMNAAQVQSAADSDTCREAVRVAKVLSNPRTYNMPKDDALRAVVGSDKADYLFSRFAQAFGWTSLSQAQRFYDDNKGGKGGWHA